LSQNEIDAAKTVQVSQLNVQSQEKFVWGKKLVIAKAYLDQLERSKGLPIARITAIRKSIENAETAKNGGKLKGSVAFLEKSAKTAKNAADAVRLKGLAEVMKQPEM
jgi:hypothetical protein